MDMFHVSKSIICIEEVVQSFIISLKRSIGKQFNARSLSNITYPEYLTRMILCTPLCILPVNNCRVSMHCEKPVLGASLCQKLLGAVPICVAPKIQGVLRDWFNRHNDQSQYLGHTSRVYLDCWDLPRFVDFSTGIKGDWRISLHIFCAYTDRYCHKLSGKQSFQKFEEVWNANILAISSGV